MDQEAVALLSTSEEVSVPETDGVVPTAMPLESKPASVREPSASAVEEEMTGESLVPVTETEMV